MITIGNVVLENPFLLGPMAGITDSTFRQLCREMGCSLSFSEMVSAKALYYGDKKTEQLLRVTPEEGPVGYQIFGSEPEIMAFAAEKLRERPNVLLDINMGCPVPKVVKNGEGAALMKEPKKIGEVVRQVVAAAGKPVTVKMRLGWDERHINVLECAQEAAAAGAAAVTIHGRTREQYYSGKADWHMIGKVREALNIPVIGSGDIFTPKDAFHMMEETGCEMVMIARGALGNPWLFRSLQCVERGDVAPEAPAWEEIVAMMRRQLDGTAAQKGERTAVMEMRKHVGWYIKGARGATRIRQEVNKINDIDQLRGFLTSLIP